MPTPDRTSLDDIVRAGRDILESDGLAGLTMRAVAERVGVRAPSLYKRVRDRDELVVLIAEATALDLGDRLDAVAARSTGDVTERFAELARALRAFAHVRPAGYGLLVAPASEATRAGQESLNHSVAAVLDVAADLAGADDGLEAARTITAWATGFISMELAGAFQLGGDVDRAFEFGISRLVVGLAR